MPVTIFNILSTQLIEALSHTLLQSLWQGLILSTVAALIMVGTRKHTPALRYNLLLVALLAFALVAAYTFFNQLTQTDGVLRGQASPLVASGGQASITGMNQLPTAAPSADWKLGIVSFLDLHRQQVVAIWLLVVGIKSLQLLTGLQGLHFLRRKKINYADAAWQQRVTDRCRQMGITKMVMLAESALAKAPMMIGHFKPLILVPLGLLTALSPAEIDAIIIHELAHIRRKDYLANLLQSLLEILFFFNPAVLWVSALLKKERENCCDDLVIGQTGNHISYIKALLACQEYNGQPQLAMGLKGAKRGSLLSRVNRMLAGSNTSLNKTEQLILALCLVITCVFSVGFSNPQAVKKIAKGAVAMVKQATIKLTPVNKPAPVEQTAAVTNKLTANPLASPADTSGKKTPQELAALDAKLHPLQTGLNDQDAFNEANINHNINTQHVLAQSDSIAQSKRLNHNLNGLGVTLGRIDVNVDQPAAEPVSPGSANRYKDYKNNYKPYRADTARKAIVSPVAPIAPVVKANRTGLGDAIIADMLKDGLISTAKGLSFKISTEVFEVNGKVQPDNVYQRYRKKFVPETKPGDGWTLYHDYDERKTITPRE